MFRILIIEDVEETVEQLQSLLLEAFPGAQADKAANAEEALRRIQESVEPPAWPYDAVVTDFRIPRSRGGLPEVHPEVFQAIRDHLPNGVVAGITAFSAEEDVIDQLLNTLNRGPDDPRSFWLSKTQNEWPTKLVRRLAAHLYDPPIEAKVDKLAFSFRSRASDCPGGPWPGVSMTHELADLTREIVQHWDYLSEGLKRKIRSVFDVNESERPIRISLLRHPTRGK